MILLTFYQGDRRTDLGLFESEENAKNFVKQIPGYFEEVFDYDGEEWITNYLKKSEIPEKIYITNNGNEVPITKYMFPGNEDILIVFAPIENLDRSGRGVIEGATLVDAYVVNNEEVFEYIENRERMYKWVKEYLSKENIKVDRNFQGSEDGEAIVYKRENDKDWHFLTHMDSSFVELVKNSEEERIEIIRYWILV